jgi:predicted nucleotidyltransferase
MKYKRLNITLAEDVVSRADEYAARERYSRSGLIAAALEAFTGGADVARESTAVYGAGVLARTAASDAPDLDRIAPLVRAYFSAGDDVVAAWVFGSVARGQARGGSDVDIAILPAEGLDAEAVWALRADAMSRLPGVLGVGSVDVVSLPDVGAVLGHRIVVEGSRVFGATRREAAEAEIAAIREYMNFAPVSRMLDRRLSERLGVNRES